ncbi:hypothetical protein [Enterobacter sp. Bisph1]|uniref:hypothetical protein n=1 Tax=Enterobacter sp. Bisph1 TaxID=1274399 RepID=UPI001E49E557|nr:hypothetical protein [Enterobacter sp. Bisph1]
MIVSKMQADRHLALVLDRAVAGVRDEVIKQGVNLQDGMTRLAFYASCFTKNYREVCVKQKAEDVRFAENIFGLLDKRDVIQKMIRIYVDLLLQNLTPERLRRIESALVEGGANIVSASWTNQALAAAITTAASYSFGISVSVDRAVLRYSLVAVTLTGWYAYIQKAADAADRIKQQNAIYYQALYAEKLEMLYFLIEPVISRNPSLNRIISSDDEITAAILRIIR